MNEIIEKALSMGVFRANIINTADLKFDSIFRKYCADNRCGFYGNNHMCPPDVGTVDEVRARVLSFDKGIYFQTVSDINGFSDSESLEKAAFKHNNLSNDIKKYLLESGYTEVLAMGTKCRYCQECTKIKDLPCIHPDLAISCLSAYCIDVLDMAKKLSMDYNLGDRQIAYFGLVLFK